MENEKVQKSLDQINIGHEWVKLRYVEQHIEVRVKKYHFFLPLTSGWRKKIKTKKKFKNN